MHIHPLDADGFATISQVLTQDECNRLLSLPFELDAASAGSRCLLQQPWCRDLVAQLQAHPQIAAVLPEDAVAVQCTYFEKSLSRNWLVPIHQDLSIPVAARVEHPALRGWSEKEGSLYVQPPAELLEQLVAIRLHRDPCTEVDGPLQFIAGSHTQGRIDGEQAAQWRRTHPVVTCALERGDALLMRPLTLHASSKTSGTSLRRVLHFVFGPATLPYGLRWQNPV
jgi:ectoine hydroxylase-related dioxygenase (phytanoyl-CoA dioxygenase family)